MSEAFLELGKLDAAVQGAIVAGLIALLGSLVTVLAAVFTTVYQLRRDRIERKTDRALELKKEELLAALEGVSTCQSSITELANPDVPDTSINERIQIGQSKTKRAHAVADIATVRAGSEWGKEFTRQYFKLLPLRLELLSLKSDADIAQRSVNDILSERSRLNDMQRSALLANDMALFDRVAPPLEYVTSRFDPAFAEQSRVVETLLAFRTSMTLECVRAQLALRPSYNKLVKAIRRETGVDGPNSGYGSDDDADEKELFAMFHDLLEEAARTEKRIEARGSDANHEPTPADAVSTRQES